MQFVYETATRPDAEFAYSAGVKWQRTLRLKSIVMHAPRVEAAGSYLIPG